MLRSILVALDDTPGAQAARDTAIALARSTGAALTVAVVLDRPHTSDDHEAVPLGAQAFKERRDARLTAQADRDAEQALADCAAAAGEFRYATLRLEDAPEPALRQAGAAHDLVVIGRDSTLGREQTDAGVAPVIEALLRDGARPLLVVPPGAVLRDAGPVVAAYDGSAPAREAFQLFALLDPVPGETVRVVSIDATREAALALAEQGCAILRARGLAAEPLPWTGRDVTEAVLEAMEAVKARMLVMGAFGGSSLVRMLVGATTDALLRAAPVPVFIDR